MKDKQCELIRRELEELTLNEDLSAGIAEHLGACADCREFEQRQRKLRQIVGTLGTVNAPADFDFRLRARLVADSQAPTFRYWSFAVKGLATAAAIAVFAVGAFVVWQRAHRAPPAVAVVPRQQEQPAPRHQAKPVESPGTAGPVIADNKPPRKVERQPRELQAAIRPKRSLVTVDSSSTRADLEGRARLATGTLAIFPIEASSQSVRVSLDDGRGNARIVSFPGVSFGSQRAPVIGNQFAPKNVW
jgi:hypothetical protein